MKQNKIWCALSALTLIAGMVIGNSAIAANDRKIQALTVTNDRFQNPNVIAYLDSLKTLETSADGFLKYRSADLEIWEARDHRDYWVIASIKGKQLDLNSWFGRD